MLQCYIESLRSRSRPRNLLVKKLSHFNNVVLKCNEAALTLISCLNDEYYAQLLVLNESDISGDFFNTNVIKVSFTLGANFTSWITVV